MRLVDVHTRERERAIFACGDLRQRPKGAQVMTTKPFAAVLGFGLVAAWIALNFGYAILCLVGAAVFYGAAAVVQGEVDLGEVQRRLRSGGEAGSFRSPTSAGGGRRVR
jgi:type IV secretory pathway TrbD component